MRCEKCADKSERLAKEYCQRILNEEEENQEVQELPRWKILLGVAAGILLPAIGAFLLVTLLF